MNIEIVKGVNMVDSAAPERVREIVRQRYAEIARDGGVSPMAHRPY